MKKIVVLLTLFVVNLFAIDATMEIIKKSKTLPSIYVDSSKNSNSKILTKIKKIIRQDLLVSGHFNVVNDINERVNFSQNPSFYSLKKKNVDLFVNIEDEVSSFGGYLLLLKVYDVNANKLVLNKSFSTSKMDRYPFIAHRTSIAINKYLNAPPINWMDKFVIFSRYKNAKESEIVIGDYTLTYQKVLVKNGLNIFPKWASKNQEYYYYTSYNSGTPTLIRANLYTGKKQVITRSEGMLVVSDVSKNGRKLLLTMSPNGQPDIYLFDVITKIKSRITRYKGIDVGGHFVENDTKVVFVSDRLKYPNIFAKKLNSRGIERLVYHGRNNSSASTFDNYIVYSSREGDNEFSRNSFNLYLISTTSDYVRRLTTTGKNQFPKFSSDGESILFTKDYKGKSSLGIIRLNYNKSFLFPLKSGKLQSIDW